MIRIDITDHEPLVTSSLATLLGLAFDFEIAIEAGSRDL